MSIHEQLKHSQTRAANLLLKCSLDLVRHQATNQQSAEQGLTLIEGLMAIIVITITLVSITPPIFWATATRVQNQQAERALKIAQGEIDRVRTIVERNEIDATRLNRLPPMSDTVKSEADVRGNKVPAPNAAKNATQVISAKNCDSGNANDDGATPSTVSQYLQVDINGDCKADFLVQTFRSQGLDQNGVPYIATDTNRLSAFVAGVRVYSVLAEPKLKANAGQTEAASLKGTTGVGNQLTRPLAVLYSTIVRSTDSSNLDLYRRLCPSSNAGSC